MNHLRPQVDRLVFRLYGRPLHPELVETLALRRVRRDGVTLDLRITPTGHVITWDSPGVHLTEVTATEDQLLPSGGQLLTHRLHGEHTEMFVPAGGVSYQMSSQVEILSPDIYPHVHQEILADATKRGVLYHFQPHNRLGLSPLGFLVHDHWRGCLSVSTFHTFPSECTVVKTQTLIEHA